MNARSATWPARRCRRGPAATRGEPRWPVSVAVLIMIVLQLRLPGDLTPIGRWLLPVIELVVLAVLVAANPRRIDRGSPVLRGLGLGLIAVASLANAWSVALLIDDLLHGSNGRRPGTAVGHRGEHLDHQRDHLRDLVLGIGPRRPAARAAGPTRTRISCSRRCRTPRVPTGTWEPQFTDYAYVSFTNATAFSPTDTMPMSRWAKLTMMLQASVSLVTAALVIARAVNILK